MLVLIIFGEIAITAFIIWAYTHYEKYDALLTEIENRAKNGKIRLAKWLLKDIDITEEISAADKKRIVLDFLADRKMIVKKIDITRSKQ